MHVNFSLRMIPGIAVLLTGACLTFFAGRFSANVETVSKLKIGGVLLCALGAVLTICL